MIRKTHKKKPRNRCLSLSNAMICLDCEHIFSSYNPGCTCPKCTSDAVVFLSRWVPSARGRQAS